MTTRKPNFWIVTLGLLLLVGLIAGGAYALNETGLITTAAIPEEGTRPEFAELNDDETSGEVVIATEEISTAERPAPPEGMDDNHSSQALLGLAKAIGQMAIVITLVYYGQKLLGRFEKRLRKPKLTSPTV